MRKMKKSSRTALELCVVAALTAGFAAAILPVLLYPGHDYGLVQTVLYLALFLCPPLLSISLETGKTGENFLRLVALIFIECAALLMDLHSTYNYVTLLRDMNPELLEDFQLSYLAGSAQRVIIAAVLSLAQIAFCCVLCGKVRRRRKQEREETLAQATLEKM